METTIYELLGMIKDGKAPKIIIYKNKRYWYVNKEKDYYLDANYDEALFDSYVITDILDNEVIILETTITYKQENYYQYQPYTGEVEIKCNSPKNLLESNKIEKLEIIQEKNCNNNWKWKLNGYNISIPQKIIANKINEIIDRWNNDNR